MNWQTLPTWIRSRFVSIISTIPAPRATLEEVARNSNWEKRGSGQNIGHGVAFVQYANYSAYVCHGHQGLRRTRFG